MQTSLGAQVRSASKSANLTHSI